MKQCSVSVSGEGQWGAFHQHHCQKPAIVEREGELYCKIHDPEYIKQKADEREVKRKTYSCPKCGSNPRAWRAYCPFCGTKYPSKASTDK